MILLRSGFCVLALSMIGAAQAADAPNRQACDLVCDLQAYFNRDHMVIYVPAALPAAPKPVRPTKPIAKSAKPPSRPQVVSRVPIPKIAEALPTHMPALTLASRQTAQWAPPPPTPQPLPETTAARMGLPPTIPGSAPRVTPQFAPVGSL